MIIKLKQEKKKTKAVIVDITTEQQHEQSESF